MMREGEKRLCCVSLGEAYYYVDSCLMSVVRVTWRILTVA